MGHSSVTNAFRILLAGTLGVVGVSATLAQQGGHGGRHDGGMRGPVYQRKASDWMNGPGKGHGDFRFRGRPFFRQPVVPNVQSGWFTRPYPYHLDFYKMKYGGSYAPYFGNLYGPPQVVTAPPYYGPYYGDWGLGAGEYGAEGYGGVPFGQPGYPQQGVYGGPVEEGAPNGGPAMQSDGEGLPAPTE